MGTGFFVAPGVVAARAHVVTAAGLPSPAGPPVGVLYSPGVPVRFGRPARPGGLPTPEARAARRSNAGRNVPRRLSSSDRLSSQRT